MSLEHPTQILTTHDLGNLRILQQQHHHHQQQQQTTLQQHNLTTTINANVGTATSKTLFSGSLKNLNASPNMILSTIPLDGRALIIPTIANGTQQQPQPQQQQQQQQHQQQQSQINHLQQQATRFTVSGGTVTNGFRSTNAPTTIASTASSTTVTSNNISNLLAAAGVTTKTTILTNSLNNNNSNNIGAKSSSTTNNNNNNNINGNNNGNTMPATSKYLFVQQNSNGQYTTYEGSATTATATGSGNANVGNIVLLATEPINGNNSEQQHVITTTTSSGGHDNDEELRSLAWLSDSNLIKGIVTTTGGGGGGVGVGGSVSAGGGTNNNNHNTNGISSKRSNICIVNASNAHDLIEELPPHVASEENVIATTHPVDASTVPQITTLSVSDFQQQFIASNKRFTPSNNAISGGNGTLSSFSIAQDANKTANNRDGPQHIYSNIAALGGATTSVHVGPSGTTTVVEYKTTNGSFIPAQRPLLTSNGVPATTTITATNLSNNQNNNNNNTNVPSSSSTSAASTMQKTLMTLPNATTLLTTASSNVNANGNQQHQSVVNGNNTTNTIYQGQKQHNASNNNNSSNTNTVANNAPTTAASTTTTTHHPHKKYLREKMNVLDHGGGGNSSGTGAGGGGGGGGCGSGGGGNSSGNSSIGGNGNNNGVALALVVSSAPASVISTQSVPPASTITVVASPASSLSSSSSSTSSSTAAVNGGNSPVSKSYFTLGNGNSVTAIAVNYASNSSNSPSPPTGAVVSSPTTLYVTTTSSAAPLPTAGLPASYTIVNPTSQHNVGSTSAIISSPEPQNTKDYYTLTNVSQLNNNHNNNHNNNSNNNTTHHHSQQQQRLQHQTHQPHQQQQQQQQHHQLQQHHQHQSMRSPISHSSYDNDSLKDFETSPNESIPTNTTLNSRLGTTSTPSSAHHSNSQAYHTPSSSTGKSNSSHASGSTTPQKQKHPNNVPYDPLVHTHNKPPYSFSSLIFMAIEDSQEKALPVKEIYAWIVQHFPYFKTAPTGWKNSVRHNLSLNKSFVKVEKAPNMGKGSLWRVEQQQRQNLLQALTRSPFFPNSAVEKIGLKNSGNGNIGSGNGNNNTAATHQMNNVGYDVVDGALSPPPPLPPQQQQQQASPNASSNIKSHLNSRFDPQLFPNLSKTFKDMSEPSGVLSDVPDDEYPSDYSTTNHNNSNNKNTNNMNNKTNSNNNKYNNNNTNNNNYNMESNGITIGGSANGVVVMGPFSTYDSIERLARDCGAENIDDVNAATAMLALKHGPKVFTETFQNGSPVITSSPSEDHTYSAGGGSAATSGASTPLINGNSAAAPLVLNSNGSIINGSKHNGCDNQSNCASSDAAYESSEESHNITPEELEDRKRHRDGVDALLSLSLSSVVDSTSCSPIKRPASTSVEEEHLAACLESNSNMSSDSLPQQHVGKMSLLSNYTSYSPRQSQHQLNNNHNSTANGSSILDEGYNTQTYYGTNNSTGAHQHYNHHQQQQQQHQHQQQHHHHPHHHIQNLVSSTPPKKVKSVRSLRAKFKRKAPWMR